MKAGRWVALFGFPWVAALYPNCSCGPGVCEENPNGSIDKLVKVSEEDGPLALPAAIVETVALHVAVERTDVEMPYAVVDLIPLTPNLPNAWSIPMVHDNEAVRYEVLLAPAAPCDGPDPYPFSATFRLVYADHPDEPVDDAAYPSITASVPPGEAHTQAGLWNDYVVTVTLIDRYQY